MSIEDTRELSLYQENWVPNLTRESVGEAQDIDMYELVRVVMRQRPECLIVGEVRGIEARAMFQAISTGHTAFSTMHAGPPQRVVNRLQGEPIKISKSMLASLDIMCVQLLTNMGKERIRRNQNVLEIIGLDPVSNEIRINEIFKWKKENDSFERTGESRILREITKEQGMNETEMREELKRRERVLRYMAENDITWYS